MISPCFLHFIIFIYFLSTIQNPTSSLIDLNLKFWKFEEYVTVTFESALTGKLSYELVSPTNILELVNNTLCLDKIYL